MTCCPKCNGLADWVGYSPRQVRKVRPSLDVAKCRACGFSWKYARTGRRVAIKTYMTELEG